MEDRELLKLAFKAMENSYSPYSHFRVGACVECTDGTLFKGVNIENASFGATNCAERSAVFAAYSNGYRKDTIAKLAIVSDGHRIAWPCGICRQVLTELLDWETPILLATQDEEMFIKVKDLMPYVFGPEDLEEQ